MSIIVAKSDKRARDEGKETDFFHGETRIPRQRIEQFKRRKTWKAAEPVSPGAGEYKGSTPYIWKPAYTKEDTPFNITYHTPGQDITDDPTELSAIEEDAIPPVAAINAPSPPPSPYQLLQGADFSQLHDKSILKYRMSLNQNLRTLHHGPDGLRIPQTLIMPPSSRTTWIGIQLMQSYRKLSNFYPFVHNPAGRALKWVVRRAASRLAHAQLVGRRKIWLTINWPFS